MNSAVVGIGVDVSGAALDVAVGSTGPVWQVANNEAGIAEFVMRIRRLRARLVVMEATSNLHVPLANALTAAGVPMAVVNPRFIRDFGRGSNRLAKTDVLDARLIALYGERMRPLAKPMPSLELQALQALVARRRQLSEALTVERNHLRTAHPAVAEGVRAQIAHLKQLVKDVEQEVQEQIRQHPQWRNLDRLLRSVPGVGPVTSMTLISALPELGTLNKKEIANLVGMAPLNRDSGVMRGRRGVWGGRRHVRTALYLAANVARQHNPMIKPFYQRLRDRGKHHNAVVTACGRKLIVVLNAMVQQERAWEPQVQAA